MKLTERDQRIVDGRIAEGTPWAARDDEGNLGFYPEEPEYSLGTYFLFSGDFYMAPEGVLDWIGAGACVNLNDLCGIGGQG